MMKVTKIQRVTTFRLKTRTFLNHQLVLSSQAVILRMLETTSPRNNLITKDSLLPIAAAESYQRTFYKNNKKSDNRWNRI